MACKYPSKCGAKKCEEQQGGPDFVAFEKEFGLVLPDDYSYFLLEWNCLVFMPPDGYKDAIYQQQPVHKHSEHTLRWDECNPELRFTENSVQVEAISTLFPLQSDDGGFAVSTSRAHGEFDQWTHERFFPIGSMAYDLFGLICISLSGDDRGHIFDWTHPLDFPDPEEAAKDMYNMGWLAPNFREFWEMLRLMTQNEWEDWGG